RSDQKAVSHDTAAKAGPHNSSKAHPVRTETPHPSWPLHIPAPAHRAPPLKFLERSGSRTRQIGLQHRELEQIEAFCQASNFTRLTIHRKTYCWRPSRQVKWPPPRRLAKPVGSSVPSK